MYNRKFNAKLLFAEGGEDFFAPFFSNGAESRVLRGFFDDLDHFGGFSMVDLPACVGFFNDLPDMRVGWTKVENGFSE